MAVSYSGFHGVNSTKRSIPCRRLMTTYIIQLQCSSPDQRRYHVRSHYVGFVVTSDLDRTLSTQNCHSDIIQIEIEQLVFLFTLTACLKCTSFLSR